MFEKIKINEKAAHFLRKRGWKTRPKWSSYFFRRNVVLVPSVRHVPEEGKLLVVVVKLLQGRRSWCSLCRRHRLFLRRRRRWRRWRFDVCRTSRQRHFDTRLIVETRLAPVTWYCRTKVRNVYFGTTLVLPIAIGPFIGMCCRTSQWNRLLCMLRA